jgi:putative ABC transport system substrate-binding protein
MNIGTRHEATGNSKKLKVICFALCAMLLALCVSAEAQQPGRSARLAYLDDGTASGTSELLEAFRQQMSQFGWIEGKNLTIGYRFGEGKGPDRLAGFAAELVSLKVDVIVAHATSGALAAKQATGTIPVVMVNVGDPVAAGLVASLARPGGNITGLTLMAPELGGKRLELLKETVPRLSRVAVLAPRINVGIQVQMKEIEAAARALGVQMLPLALRESNDLASAFEAATSGQAAALIMLASPFLGAQRRQILEEAAKRRIPTMYTNRQWAETGGLMSYGPNHQDLYQRAAIYVNKILKGAKPADLPVEQPTKFELVINLKTAKQIGLTIPSNVLARGNPMIEQSKIQNRKSKIARFHPTC